MNKNTKPGFTLIESLAVIAMVSLLVGVLTPAMKSARTESRGAAGAANLAFIGQASDLYASLHEGRIFNFTWKGPRGGDNAVVFTWAPSGKAVARNDREAAAVQATEILQRRTGRNINSADPIRVDKTLPAHLRLRHLVLMDFTGLNFPSGGFADTADARLLQSFMRLFLP